MVHWDLFNTGNVPCIACIGLALRRSLFSVLVPALVLNSAPRGTVCSDSTWYSWYCIEMQMWAIHGVRSGTDTRYTARIGIGRRAGSNPVLSAGSLSESGVEPTRV
jgi:hypothetical protein